MNDPENLLQSSNLTSKVAQLQAGRPSGKRPQNGAGVCSAADRSRSRRLSRSNRGGQESSGPEASESGPEQDDDEQGDSDEEPEPSDEEPEARPEPEPEPERA